MAHEETTLPLIEPSSFYKGDTVRWRKSYPSHLPATWTLTYEFVSDRNADHRSVDATDNGDNTHLLTLSVAVSTTFVEGGWHFQGKITDGSETFTVTRGRFEVFADLSAHTAGYDARSHAQKALANIEEVLLAVTTDDAVSVSAEAQSYSSRSVEELLELRNYYRAEVRAELAVARVEKGFASRNKIVTRFVRARP